MYSSRVRIRSPSLVSNWWNAKRCSSNIWPGGPIAFAGSKLKMWQTQSKTKASTLRSRALASSGRLSMVAMPSGSSLLGDPPLAMGHKLVERHHELFPGRRGQAVHRPHRIPHDLHPDRLDAVQAPQPLGDRVRHRDDERAPAARE